MEDTETRLLALIEHEGATLDERLEAGAALARLGDARATTSPRVAIGEGPFSMGEPARSVELPAFSIDRYPVTVAAYAAFVRDGGYTRRELWSSEGWAFRKAEGIVKPRFWDEPEWAAYLVPNHPVVGVSFYEAEAYAAATTARLPTEAEWEKACRGIDGRLYPWGSSWIDDACGVRGKGPRGTVPIGSYPKGRSPFGVDDMVGCVWQWCQNTFLGWGEGDGSNDDDDDAREDGQGQQRRATRGGAWNTLQWSVTTVSRNGYPPTARFSNLGFRCAVSPSKRAGRS